MLYAFDGSLLKAVQQGAVGRDGAVAGDGAGLAGSYKFYFSVFFQAKRQ